MVETNTSVLFLLHQKAQIPDSVFDLQEEICQCAWPCPGDKDILGQVAAVGLFLEGRMVGEGGEGGGRMAPAVLFLFFPCGA